MKEETIGGCNSYARVIDRNCGRGRGECVCGGGKLLFGDIDDVAVFKLVGDADALALV